MRTKNNYLLWFVITLALLLVTAIITVITNVDKQKLEQANEQLNNSLNECSTYFSNLYSAWNSVEVVNIDGCYYNMSGYKVQINGKDCKQ